MFTRLFPLPASVVTIVTPAQNEVDGLALGDALAEEETDFEKGLLELVGVVESEGEGKGDADADPQMTLGKRAAAAAAGGDEAAQSGMMTTAPLVHPLPTLPPGYQGKRVELMCAVVPVPESPKALSKASVQLVPPPPLYEP